MANNDIAMFVAGAFVAGFSFIFGVIVGFSVTARSQPND